MLNENIRQIYGRHIAHENWLTAPPLPKNMNYGWMGDGRKTIRIAHALGFSGTPLANRIEALAPLAKAAFRYFGGGSLVGQRQKCAMPSRAK